MIKNVEKKLLLSQDQFVSFYFSFMFTMVIYVSVSFVFSEQRKKEGTYFKGNTDLPNYNHSDRVVSVENWDEGKLETFLV